MSAFSHEWLALREAYDVAARNAAVLDAVAAAFAGRASIALVDLACGTGATLRAISARLPSQQNWRLVDNDLSLLARAAGSAPAPGQTIAATPVDIARDLELALDGPLDLVVTSALLDLVSDEWLERFATETAVRALPVYAALTYDGRVDFDPHDVLDAMMIAAINRHQLGDKGFGPALGPAAANAATASFEALNYAVARGSSDWTFGPQDEEIQSEFIAGWAAAASEGGELSLEETAGWFARRREHVKSGRSSIRVGHVDFFAQPTRTR
jgi:hypothetical protein